MAQARDSTSRAKRDEAPPSRKIEGRRHLSTGGLSPDNSCILHLHAMGRRAADTCAASAPPGSSLKWRTPEDWFAFEAARSTEARACMCEPSGRT
eukprot:CAMPEP_0198504688 /NCGR_PEP_ID=MMETSP1462-20131121/10626_1 /TAXON_ID=1333877 /ORGANISM="Brandtodinium nutriculum, Strain RCC3387" /LENGTH=94 /DNA_ID=CAMNT_0044233861 /DNA_START=211 /DNA_END=491 /DNA_ORIENTATION=-